MIYFLVFLRGGVLSWTHFNSIYFLRKILVQKLTNIVVSASTFLEIQQKKTNIARHSRIFSYLSINSTTLNGGSGMMRHIADVFKLHRVCKTKYDTANSDK